MSIIDQINPDSLRTLNLMAQALFDKKGFNILALDVRGVCSFTDYFLIAEGTVGRHVRALAHTILRATEHEGIVPVHVEGNAAGEWIVLDYFDIVVHLFTPGFRDLYRLEELWSAGNIVDLLIKTTNDSDAVQE